jgi:hypothetical protein
MGYAAYGNHSETPSGRPGATDLPPEAGPEEERRIAEARFARIKPGETPPGRETSSHRRGGNPAVSPEATREISTPGEGAGPLPTGGDEVDPGVG